MDAGFQSRDYKGVSVNGITSNGSSTSQLNIRGTEDLGGGLKASFRVETDWNPVSNGVNQQAATYTNSPAQTSAASTFGNGELRVGVAGDFGASLTALVTATPFGTAIGGGYSKIIKADYNGVAVRSDNSFRYTSPTFSGFSANVLYSAKQSKGIVTSGVPSTMGPATNALGYVDQTGVTELAANYANGPFALVASNLVFDRSGVGANGTGATSATSVYNNSKTTLNTFAGSYTIDALKLGAMYQTNKGDGTNFVDQKAYALSATYTMGALVLMAEVGSLDNRNAVASSTAGASTVVGKSKLTGLGADYNLSKRTALYARYEKINDDANLLGAYSTAFSTGVTGTSRSLTGVGVRHAF
jgi:predicted porin